MSVVTAALAAAPLSQYIPGLEGVVAAQTCLSRVDGEAGELVIPSTISISGITQEG